MEASWHYIETTTTTDRCTVTAASMAVEAANQRHAILCALQTLGPRTADELDALCGWRPTSAGRRIPDLVTDGLVEFTGEKRLTRSGRRANVYRATNKKEEAA